MAKSCCKNSLTNCWPNLTPNPGVIHNVNCEHPEAMKNTLIILFTSFSLTVFAMNPVKAHEGVPVDGIVTEEGKKCKDATVQLFRGNEEVQQVISKNGKFNFLLDFNYYYTIVVSKKGMVSKMISVDTRVESTRIRVPVYECGIYLISESLLLGMSNSILDFPMAIVAYNRSQREFAHNEDYTLHMREAYQALLEKSFANNEANNR